MADGEEVGGVVPGVTSTDSGRANGAGTPNGAFVTGRRPSGVDCSELFAPAWEHVEARLLRDEEEELVAKAGVTVSGIEEVMNCFDERRANEPCRDETRERRGRDSPLRTGEAWTAVVGEFMIGNGSARASQLKLLVILEILVVEDVMFLGANGGGSAQQMELVQRAWVD